MAKFKISEDKLKKYAVEPGEVSNVRNPGYATFKISEEDLKKYTVQPIRQASKPQNKNIRKAAGDADKEVSTAKAKPKTSGSLSAYDEAVRRSFNDASGNYNPQTGINEGYGTVTPGAKPINALLDVIYNKAVNPIANKAYDVYEKADDYAVNEDYLSRMKAAAEEQAQGQAFNDESLRLNRALNERKQWLSGMTDEQKRAYLLLPEKERKDYLDSIEDELNQKAGIKEAQYVLGKGKETASPAGYAFAAGVQNFKSGLEGAVNLLRGKEGETATRGDLEYAYGAVAPTLEGGHKVLSDLAYTTGNMAPSMALGLVSGGLGTAAMGISSAGNSYDQAIREGYKPEESAAYGIASGIKEAALQRVAGALPGVSNAQSVLSKALGKYGDKAAKALIKNEALRTSLERIVGNALSEGSEEYVQEILDPILRNIFLKEDNEVKLFTPEAAYAGFLGGISGGMFELPGAIRAGVEVKRGKAPHSISLEEFTNNDSPIWNNVDYNDKETQVKITKELHDRMVQNNEVVDVPETERVNEAHPDLTHLKKKERNVILRDKIKQLKTDLKTMLEGLGETPVEFNVNNNLIEARLYGTGIREVLKKLTKDKSNMLYQSKEIFKNSKYLYSTQDYDGNEGIYRWNYFYTPVKIGDDIVGVRIAVRDMKKAAESQLYSWDIKKEAPVEGTQGGLNLARELSHKEASGSAEPNNIISDNIENINNLGAETEITNRQNTESLQPELRDSLETTEEETVLPERDTESLQPEATDELTTTEETAPRAEEEVRESAERAAMRRRALETVNKNSPDAQRIYREIMSNYGYGKVIQNMDAAAEKLGTKITYYAEDGRAEGYAEDGSIYLNVKNLRSTQEGVWRLFKHELSHTLQGATKAYGKLFSSKAGQELFNKFLKDNGYANITELENEIRSRYGKNSKSLTEEELNYELMARFIEDSDILTSEESIRKLTEASPNLAERIIEWFKYMRTMFKGTEYDKQLAQAERLYLKAVKEAQKNGAYRGGREYSIGKTDKNVPFVEVEQDILKNVPEKDWIKTVRDNLKNKFPNGIDVGNNKIYIDYQSRNEITKSRYTTWLAKNDSQTFADKFAATDNSDEVIKATTSWVNEGLNHPRKDNITDFARGNVLLRIGNNDYTAEVVVGKRSSGKMILYDILKMQPTSFVQKKTSTAIAENPSPGTNRNTVPLFNNSIHSQNGIGNTNGGNNNTNINQNSGTKQFSIAKESETEIGDTETSRYSTEELLKDTGKALEARKQAESDYRAYEKAANKAKLTPKDRVFLDLLYNGVITDEDIPANSISKIESVYPVYKACRDARQAIADSKKAAKVPYKELAERAAEGSDGWKDKKAGIFYSTEIMERNIEDITKRNGGRKNDEAKFINDNYFKPIHHNEAEATRYKNSLTERINGLDLKNKKLYRVAVRDERSGVPTEQLVSERALVQLYGEGLITEQTLNKTGADAEKIKRAKEEMRSIYDELFDKANEALIRNGYEPIAKRADYFPHFTEDRPDTLLGKAAAAVGIDITGDALPTDIAGITNAFRPGKKWVGNFLRREGTKTDYDVLKGFDRYLGPVSDVIYHTDDIQRLRAFETELRYKYSDKGIQDRIERIRNDETLTPEDRNNRLEALYNASKMSHLPNLVTELRSYTDTLAGKKHKADRFIEDAVGRGVYKFLKSVYSKTGANMVAVNVGSWLTNLIPVTQALGVVKSDSMAKAIFDTIKAQVQSDGFAEKSDFLINRRGSENVSRTMGDKAAGYLTKPFEIIDNLSAEIVTRAIYYDNMRTSLNESTALEYANDMAARLMADRSKGSVPTLFNVQNPLVKTFTMFQLEVNNQYKYYFKDVPADVRTRATGALATAFFKMFLAAFLYNKLYKKIVGRNAATDPIDIALSAAGNYYEAYKGNQSYFKATVSTAKDIAEEVPFIGGVLGGGRVPMSSVMPDAGKLAEAGIGLLTGEMDEKKAMTTITQELMNPALYLLMPIGGGQAKKFIQGVKTVWDGGEYIYDKEGNKKLKYPIDKSDPLKTKAKYVQAAVFGKSALPEAQYYYDKGFKTLTVKQTEQYPKVIAAGITYQQYMEALTAARKAESDKDKDGEAIPLSLARNKKRAIDKVADEYGLTERQRKILYEANGVSEKVY